VSSTLRLTRSRKLPGLRATGIDFVFPLPPFVVHVLTNSNGKGRRFLRELDIDEQ
jgi:hypothetical protein